MVAIEYAPIPRARMFPSPLNAEMVRLALQELGDGQRHSTETCVQCWQDKRLSDDDIIQIMMALCGQSAILRRAFRKTHRKHSDLQEVASAEDLFFLLSLSSAQDAPPPLQRTSSCGASPTSTHTPEAAAFAWGAAIASGVSEVAFDVTATKKMRSMHQGAPHLLACL